MNIKFFFNKQLFDSQANNKVTCHYPYYSIIPIMSAKDFCTKLCVYFEGTRATCILQLSTGLRYSPASTSIRRSAVAALAA